MIKKKFGKRIIAFGLGIVAMLGAFIPTSKQCIFVSKGSDQKTTVEAQELAKTTLKEELNINAKSSLLIDAKTGAVLYSDNDKEMLPIASMTKLMTMKILEDKIDRGEASLEDMTVISEHSASMDGSECFLDSGRSYKVYELLKAVAISSANDACVALAEYMSGNENVFVSEMNKKASELGLKNTHYSNCTGLIDEDNYSTVQDLAALIKSLSSFDVVSNFCKIWMSEITHDKGRVTELVNTNRLIRTNKAIKLAKTGFTDKAGHCMTALAEKGDMSLIVSVIGASKSEDRFEAVNSLLNYGFANYENKKVVDKEEVIVEIELDNATKDKISLYAKDDYYVLTKKGEQKNIELELIYPESVSAPISTGEVIGKIKVLDNKVMVAEIELITNESVDQIRFGEIIRKLIER